MRAYCDRVIHTSYLSNAANQGAKAALVKPLLAQSL